VINRNGTIIAHYPDKRNGWESLYWMRIIKAMLAEAGVREVEFKDGVLRLYAFTPVSYMGYADIYMVICINKDKLFVC